VAEHSTCNSKVRGLSPTGTGRKKVIKRRREKGKRRESDRREQNFFISETIFHKKSQT
jgi:hypothetical protein